MRRADLREHLVHPPPLGRARAPQHAERGDEPARDDFADGGGQGGIERGLLRDIAQAPPLGEGRGDMPEEPHLAARGLQQTQHQAQQGGLAGAVGADDAEEVARLDGEVDAVEHRHLSVGEADVVDLDEGPHVSPPSAA
jgi:hypothetical protein